jgi:hypothetical protein
MVQGEEKLKGGFMAHADKEAFGLSRPLLTLLGSGFLALALFGRPAPAPAQRYVSTGDTLHPRVKYADSLTSLNDRCIVRMTRLSRRVRPTYVNGQPVGFC